MKYRELGKTGLLVSVIGFGASPLGNEFGETDADQSARAVHVAVDQGINFFDVSPYYGRTLAEKRLGDALAGKRTGILLGTKCGRYDKASFDFSAKRVTESLEGSLRRLRTDYLDLYQVHDLEFADARQIIEETIPAMEEVKRQGKVRCIGITGFPLRVLRRVAAEVSVDTILSYSRCNLLVDDLNGELAGFADALGIGLINASPLHMGMLTEAGPPAWHPAPPEVAVAARVAVSFLKGRGVNPSQFALRYCLDFPLIATTLVGMATEEHVIENVMALEAQIDPTILAKVESIISPAKNRVWTSGRPENQDPGLPG